MYHYTRKIICLSILFSCSGNLQAQSLTVMTYNVRFDNPADSINNWDHRKADVVKLINFYHPEIFGIQEGLLHQLQYLDTQLSDYSRIGVGRDDGKEKGEYSAIYWDSKKMSVVKSSTFWLSDTPEKISVGWDAAMERICTYGIFEFKKNGKQMLILNTHFDHMGKLARLHSAELIMEKIKMLNQQNLPVIMMGDLNSEPGSEPIRVLSNIGDAGILSSDDIYGPVGTFTGFQNSLVPNRRIDHIFISGAKSRNYRHIDDRRVDGGFISDHLPVMVEIDM